MYVTINSPSTPTSCLLYLHPFLLEGLRSTLRSHPHSTPSHCLHLGSPTWSGRSPLAETLPLNPNLSVKARRRSVTLPFFCSLLKQRHKRLFYNTLSMVYMDKRMFYSTLSMVCMDKRMQDFNRLSSKKYANVFIKEGICARQSPLWKMTSLYRNCITSHPVSGKRSSLFAKLHARSSILLTEKLSVTESCRPKKCACVCTKLVKTPHKTERLHWLCRLSEMTVHFEMLSPDAVQNGTLVVFFILASGEKCFSQLRPCDIKIKSWDFDFSLVFFFFSFL